MGAVQSVTFTSYAVVSGTITLTANVVIRSGETADVSEFVYILYAGGTTYDPATPTSQSPASGEYTNDFTLTLTFSALDFPNLYISEQGNTYTVQYPAGDQVGQASYTYYSSPPTIEFTSFTVILYQLDNTIIRANFTYNSSGFEPSTSNFIYYLNGSILDNSYITWNITDNESGGVGFADFSRVGAVTAALFLQASTQTHFIRYQDNEIGPFNTSTITTKFTVSDSNNIIIQNPVTIVTISAYKSIILPPVATKKGILYHFKILTATAPYTFRIVPYFSVSPPIPPLLTSLYSSLTFDSVIEGVAGPVTMSSTRNTLTLISDGTSWSILNRYTDTLTIGALTSAPTNTLSETTETKSFQYTYVNSEGDYYSKILLASSTSSYLKYIFITNADSSSLEFTIYLPISKAFETSPAISSRYALFTFTIPAGKVAGFILTYVNDTYYIISASINPSISTEGTISATPTIISSTVSLLQSQPAYQISYSLPNFNSSISQLLILKSVTTPTVQGEDNVQFRLTKDPVSIFSLSVGSAVWFIGHQFSETRQDYLAVSYYVPPA
jgi:hypothetical protein